MITKVISGGFHCKPEHMIDNCQQKKQKGDMGKTSNVTAFIGREFDSCDCELMIGAWTQMLVNICGNYYFNI